MTTTALTKSKSGALKLQRYLPIIIVLISIIFALYYSPPTHWDWRAYREGAINLLALRSPYQTSFPKAHAGPPWTFIFLIPFAVFPLEIGGAMIYLANFIAFGIIAHRMGARP